MPRLYIHRTNGYGFYDDNICGPYQIENEQGELVDNPDCKLPPKEEVLEISAEQHQYYFAEAHKRNCKLYVDDKNQIVFGEQYENLRDPVDVANHWRRTTLSSLDALVNRHRDEVDMGIKTTLTQDQFKDLLLYKQAIRDWPEQLDFPKESSKPSRPSWL